MTKNEFKEIFETTLKYSYNTNAMGSTPYERYCALAQIVNSMIEQNKEVTDNSVKKIRKLIYFSMEFLLGRLITNNLYNLGIYEVVKDAFIDLGIDINEVEHAESDAGIGNGGLGRLAACFLDSSAALKLPVYGNSLRYKHGFFTQKIVNNKQVELPDNWLDKPFVWETKCPDEAVDIPFFGRIENGCYVKQTWVKAVPYDVSIVGYKNRIVTKLRLWSTEISDKQEIVDENYLRETAQICDCLYPDDSDDYGKLLRLKQQYVFCAAGLSNAIRDCKKNNIDLRKFNEYYVCQINDTHPALIIPELMRILMDIEGFKYDEAWSVVTKTCAFTLHTILSEALETWDLRIFQTLLPRIYEIVQEIDKRFRESIKDNPKLSLEEKESMYIIHHNRVRMANLSIIGTFSLNGVAKLHTDILKNIVMKNFYKIYPDKFNNKTNGITHRRWLMQSNPQLCAVLDEYIGTRYRKNIDYLKILVHNIEDEKLKNDLYLAKRAKKITLAKQILADTGVSLNIDSIFDVQVKRLHEYKRQLLNILHIIYVYIRLKEDKSFRDTYFPHSFIFGAKSAPGYYIAKKVIHLINAVAAKINNDPLTKDLLKVVFVTNYNVTYAEYIMPAADLSEQISTASFEASGTGNMKFMANGAITIGTLDGANVEINELVGDDNMILFGLRADEVEKIHLTDDYHPYDLYNSDERIRKAIDFMRSLTNNPSEFNDLRDNLLNRDYFLVLKDFNAYVEAHEKASLLYQDKNKWYAMAIMNIAKSPFFTSDRTIKEYNKDIWKLKKINLKGK